MERLVKIHEYQAKELLRKFNVPVPEGYVAFTPKEAVQAARKLPTVNKVVKSQIHAGGREKEAGLKLQETSLRLNHWPTKCWE
jgi:succinyl-CoA synthetase beta subunit